MTDINFAIRSAGNHAILSRRFAVAILSAVNNASLSPRLAAVLESLKGVIQTIDTNDSNLTGVASSNNVRLLQSIRAVKESLKDVSEAIHTSARNLSDSASGNEPSLTQSFIFRSVLDYIKDTIVVIRASHRNLRERAGLNNLMLTRHHALVLHDFRRTLQVVKTTLTNRAEQDLTTTGSRVTLMENLNDDIHATNTSNTNLTADTADTVDTDVSLTRTLPASTQTVDGIYRLTDSFNANLTNLSQQQGNSTNLSAESEPRLTLNLTQDIQADLNVAELTVPIDSSSVNVLYDELTPLATVPIEANLVNPLCGEGTDLALESNPSSTGSLLPATESVGGIGQVTDPVELNLTELMQSVDSVAQVPDPVRANLKELAAENNASLSRRLAALLESLKGIIQTIDTNDSNLIGVASSNDVCLMRSIRAVAESSESVGEAIHTNAGNFSHSATRNEPRLTESLVGSVMGCLKDTTAAIHASNTNLLDCARLNHLMLIRHHAAVVADFGGVLHAIQTTSTNRAEQDFNRGGK